MQISTYDAVKLGFVLGENGERLNENDYKDSSSFDLEVKAILTLDTNTNEVINSRSIQNLKPQACAYLVSKQYICVPKGYIAYVFLKNRMGQRGLLALNTGIIDQNYYGPISTLVINLSKNHAAIPDLATPTDLTFFRIVFHKVDFSDTEENEELSFPNRKYEYETYLGNCKRRLLDYPENFLNTGVIEKRLEAAITQKAGDFSLRKLMVYLSLLAVIFTLLPFLRDNFFAWRYDLKSSSEQILENKVISKSISDQILSLQKEVNELKDKVINLENKKGEQIETHPIITQNLNMSLPKEKKADADKDTVKKELINQLFTK